MKERPILFSAPMVRALLSGTKTQTRRAVKGVKHFPDWGSAVGMVGGAWRYGSPAGLDMSDRGDNWSVTLDADHLRRMCASVAYGWGAGAGCPYGQPGDLLWVRETFFARGRWETRFSAKKGRDDWHFIDMTLECGQSYLYAADGVSDTKAFIKRRGGVEPMYWKRPAIFMPRAACRITLEITGVRVERLQDISESDAKAEGCERLDDDEPGYIHRDEPDWKLCPRCGGTRLYTSFHPVTGGATFDADCEKCDTYVKRYQHLWTAINGPESWEANPWVWIVEFKRKEPA